MTGRDFDHCVTFVGGEAVDDGGPQREFLSLVLQEIAADSNIFQGLPHSRFLLHNVQALVARKFFYAGMLVAVSHACGTWHYVNNMASAWAKLTFVFSLISSATFILSERMLQEQEDELFYFLAVFVPK